MTKTTFAAGKNPFTGMRSDSVSFKISADPMPEKRVTISKYDETFNKLKVGQCLIVPTQHVGKVSNSMRKWAMKNKNYTIKSCENYPGDEGNGRIWLLTK